jgi:hypothetical protein
MGVAGRRRRRVEPTDEWEQLQLLCRWPEQLAYEEIRPLVLFGMPVAERAGETGSSERTLYRRISRFDRISRFEAEGMGSLFAPGNTKRRALPPSMRRFIVDLKAEHPHMSSIPKESTTPRGTLSNVPPHLPIAASINTLRSWASRRAFAAMALWYLGEKNHASIY